MWPDRRLTELFEIEHPLVLAPMAGLGTIGLAASVCEAGGLGSLGCATMQPQLVAKTIQELRALTSKPINVNFFCHAQAKSDPDREHVWQDRLLPYFRELGIDYESPRSRLDIPPFGDAMCTVVDDSKPEVVSFHFGLPAPALPAWVKAAGCRVMSSATTVEEALWLEAGGVDAIIAQGYEAGGHRGMFLAANLSSAIVSQPGTLPLSVEDLASTAALSRFHFTRAFKAATGKTPRQHVSERRLQLAKSLLAGGDRSLMEIALACNFSSQANFARAFRRSTGVTPGKYRAKAAADAKRPIAAQHGGRKQ
jgi:AraC-like DNA-binding protein